MGIHGIAVTERVTFKVSSKIWLMALALEISIGFKLAQLDAACEAEEELGTMSTIVLLAVAVLTHSIVTSRMVPGKFSILPKTRAIHSLPSRWTHIQELADPHLLSLCLSLHLSRQSLRR